LIRLRRPSDREISEALESRQPFTYPEVGATAKLESPDVRESLANRYDVDRHEFILGTGLAVFERARSALMAWRQFEIPWLRLHGSGPVAADQVVATVASVAGFWFLNPCRVVYVRAPSEATSFAYAYGTLRGHVECGEERFQVSLDPTSDQVVYEIVAFSRPALFLSRVGYPFARRVQRRFAVSSARALARAVDQMSRESVL
jgi:uncharacterized protein (UPF0548 family)